MVRDKSGSTLLQVLASASMRELTAAIEKDAVLLFKKLMGCGVNTRQEKFKMRTAIDCAMAEYNAEIDRLFRGDDKEIAPDDDNNNVEGGEAEEDDELSEPGYEMVNSTC